jgi:hypothetical protein
MSAGAIGLLSVSTSPVYRWCSNEQLPYFRLGSDHAAIRISGADEHGEDRSVRAGGDGDRRSPVDGDDQEVPPLGRDGIPRRGGGSRTTSGTFYLTFYRPERTWRDLRRLDPYEQTG